MRLTARCRSSNQRLSHAHNAPCIDLIIVKMQVSPISYLQIKKEHVATLMTWTTLHFLNLFIIAQTCISTNSKQSGWHSFHAISTLINVAHQPSSWIYRLKLSQLILRIWTSAMSACSKCFTMEQIKSINYG